MRGKPAAQGPLGRWRRNIPAYAGKTTNRSSVRGCAAEHPRVCGENRPLRGRWGGGEGTSPRMRGKPQIVAVYGGVRRNIPAYAGKTPAQCPRTAYHEEHPRVCGENPGGPLFCSMLLGTSPRMRGKLFGMCATSSKKRNIPAYAGKTQKIFIDPPRIEEHPRVCGENRVLNCSSMMVSGTSPRMRGKR